MAASTGNLRSVLKALAAILVLELVSTARHEGSHAVMAWIEGAHVAHVHLLPGIHPQLGFTFGWVRWSGTTTWLTLAAPYLCAAGVLVAYFFWARRSRPRGFVRTTVILLGLVSPVIDLAYNYQGGFWRPGNDVARLLHGIPPVLVHGFFVCSLALGLLLILDLRRERRADA